MNLLTNLKLAVCVASFLVLSTATVQAKELLGKATTDDGRTVLLYADGDWVWLDPPVKTVEPSLSIPVRQGSVSLGDQRSDVAARLRWVSGSGAAEACTGDPYSAEGSTCLGFEFGVLSRVTVSTGPGNSGCYEEVGWTRDVRDLLVAFGASGTEVADAARGELQRFDDETNARVGSWTRGGAELSLMIWFDLEGWPMSCTAEARRDPAVRSTVATTYPPPSSIKGTWGMVLSPESQSALDAARAALEADPDDPEAGMTIEMFGQLVDSTTVTVTENTLVIEQFDVRDEASYTVESVEPLLLRTVDRDGAEGVRYAVEVNPDGTMSLTTGDGRNLHLKRK